MNASEQVKKTAYNLGLIAIQDYKNQQDIKKARSDEERALKKYPESIRIPLTHN